MHKGNPTSIIVELWRTHRFCFYREKLSSSRFVQDSFLLSWMRQTRRMEKKESRPLSLSSFETSNVHDIVYSKMASLKQGRVHWWFSKFLGEWQTCHSEKIDFIASQVCYQRLLLSIERAANASHQSQHPFWQRDCV